MGPVDSKGPESRRRVGRQGECEAQASLWCSVQSLIQRLAWDNVCGEPSLWEHFTTLSDLNPSNKPSAVCFQACAGGPEYCLYYPTGGLYQCAGLLSFPTNPKDGILVHIQLHEVHRIVRN